MELVRAPAWCPGDGRYYGHSLSLFELRFLSFPPQVGGSCGPSRRPLPSLPILFSRRFLNGIGQLQADIPAKSLTGPEALNASQSLSVHICKMGSLGNTNKTKTDKAFLGCKMLTGMHLATLARQNPDPLRGHTESLPKAV